MTIAEKTALDEAVFNTASKLSQIQQGKTWGKLLNGKPMIKRRDIHMCLQYSGFFTGASGDREGMTLSGSISRLDAQGLVERVEKDNRIFVIVK